MQYKTIALQVIEHHPAYDRLRMEGLVLATMERYATQLKLSQEAWKEKLAEYRPSSDPSQITSEAMELAVEELGNRLSCDIPPPETADSPDATGPCSLDGAMAFIRQHPRSA